MMNRLKIFISNVQSETPGQLPHELTVEDLYKPHRSSPPNILLAEPMYWNGYIENSVADEMNTYKNGGAKSRKKIFASIAENSKETTNELSILDATSI